MVAAAGPTGVGEDAADRLRASLTPPPSPEPATGTSDRRTRVLAAVLLTVVVASGVLFLFNRSSRDRERIVPRRSVAVLGFRNLTGSPEVSWLETALAEMLTIELARGEALRAVPRGERGPHPAPAGDHR